MTSLHLGMSTSARKQSSEYSADSSKSSGKNSEEIKVNEDEKKQARSHLYSVLFHEKLAILGIFPSVLQGAVPIVMYLFFGKILNELSYYTMAPLYYKPMDNVKKWACCMFGIAVGSGIFKFFDSFCWIRVGSLLSTKIRKDLFQNMMRSEVTFFDVNPIGGILTLLSEDAQLVQDAFGTTKGTQVANLGQFLTGIVLAYVYNWKLALIITADIPVIFIIIGCFMPGVVKHSTLKFNFVSTSMTIAEETLGAIRTVRGYNREEKETERFVKETELSAKEEKTIGYLITAMMGLVMIIIWGSILGILYYGATLVKKGRDTGDDSFEVGDLFSLFGFAMFGCFGIIQLQGSLQGEQKAIAAGARILKLSTHKPEVQFDGGRILENFQGHIEFKHVSFKYPTRDAYVLRDVSFEIKPGQMGALVGHSGSGKSTCVQLIERYYDVTEGFILIDGVDIRELDPRWLHRKVAVVAQEPTLFQMSIKDNIKYGVPENTPDEEVFAAAEVANCKKFVDKLSHGFDELVGEKGAALSGGQRQRVAIARAVIKKPVILITDEATSALDAGSEKKVQSALDNVMKGLTAVVVAHRLSTIRNASIIYVFDAGEIKEVGTHESLVAARGVYYNLVSRQLTQADAKIHEEKPSTPGQVEVISDDSKADGHKADEPSSGAKGANNSDSEDDK